MNVQGTCVDLKVIFSTSNIKHRSKENAASNFGNPENGEVREIYVNAVSLDEIYEPVRAPKFNILNYVLGFSFVGAAVLGIVLGYLV